MKKVLLYLLLVLPFLIGSCQKNDLPDPGRDNDTTHIPGLPKEGVLIQTSAFGRIVDEQDKPISGVMVKAGSSSVTTDVNGIYFLNNVMLDQARAYITASKTGYFTGSRIFQPLKNELSKPPLIKLLKQVSIGKINATTGGVAGSANGTRVQLPANAVENYSGQIDVVAAYINPTSPDFFARMPGDLGADNAENKRGSLISYGMSNIDLLDDRGNKLKIKTGMQADVSIPVPLQLQKFATPVIAMWHFDETKGIWKEEGNGTYANGKYTGKVSHFSTWNYDHWNPIMIIPIFLRWILPNLSSMPPEDLDHILNNPPDFIIQVRDKKTKNTLFTSTLPPPVRNNDGSTSETVLPLPNMSEQMEVTVQPVQPGGPDYPQNNNYTPVEGEQSPQTPSFATEQESVTVDYTPTNPPTRLEIVYPPAGNGGGSGETIVNVNGKAVNCDNQPVKTGYAFLSMRSGNTIVRSTIAPVFGNEGRFTVQYFFPAVMQNRIDNVVLTVYDLATGKKTKDLKYNVNPSVALMLQEPVKICEENNGGDPTNDKIYNGNYSINNANDLKTFIDSAYTKVSGILYVGGNISDLGGIVSLKKVWGLELRQTALTNLGGLAELEEINSIVFVSNNQLTNIAFPKLTTKTWEGGISLTGNLALAALTLPSVESINPSGNSVFDINTNPQLKTISIPNLTSLKCGYVRIANTLLENVNTFSNTGSTLGSWGLTLEDNSELKSVSGLKNIISTARLTISDCPKLTTLDGINIPASMTDWISIQRNATLSDISSVATKVKTIGSGGLTVRENNVLQTANFTLLESTDGANIAGNAKLTTLAFPKLAEGGSISISNNPKISSINLDALENLSGSFSLEGGYEDGQVLKTFDLPKLKSVQRFTITNAPAITNLDGFASLEKVDGDLTISNANFTADKISLKTIGGFNKLKSITYGLGLYHAAGSSFAGPLTSIKGFQQLSTIGGDLSICGLNLTDVSGFNNLSSVFYSVVINSTALKTLDDFPKLQKIGDDPNIVRTLQLTNNAELLSLTGLKALNSIRALNLTGNSKLRDLNGLEKIKSIKWFITLIDNTKLENLDGLVNVDGAISGIRILGNTALNSFCGLSKLVNGGGNTGEFNISTNGYNPTLQQMKDGKCSK